MGETQIAAQLFQAVLRHATHHGMRLGDDASDRLHDLSLAAGTKIAALPPPEIPAALRATQGGMIRVVDHAAARDGVSGNEALASSPISAAWIDEALQSLCQSCSSVIRRLRCSPTRSRRLQPRFQP